MSRVHAVNTRAAVRLALIAALLALAGCTGKFLYNRLDFIIPFYIGQRVTLDETQEAHLKGAVKAFTAWHRSSQLQRYSTFLRELAARAAQPTTRAEVEATANTLEGFLDDTMAEIAPDAARWLSSLSPEQVDELMERYAEDDEDEREEYCEPPPEKQIAKRSRTLKRSVKGWAGALDDAQEAVIERTSRDMRLTGCAWLDHRARWRAELKRALTDEMDETARQERLRELMIYPRNLWTEDYRRDFETNRALIIDMVTELDASWSAKQRQSIVRRLTNIADDLDELAAG